MIKKNEDGIIAQVHINGNIHERKLTLQKKKMFRKCKPVSSENSFFFVCDMSKYYG